MHEYPKIALPSAFSVQSIVTVYDFHLTGQDIPGEAHDFWEFIYVMEGEHLVVRDGKEYRLAAGQMLFYPPCADHEGPPSRAHIGIVSFECGNEKMDHFRDQVITLTARQQEWAAKIIAEGCPLFRAAPNVPDYALQSLKNKLELLLIELYRPVSAARPSSQNQNNYRTQQISALTDYLRAHLSESISLEQMSEVAGMSVSHLQKLFRQQMGCGPASYLLQLKIEAAKRLIRETPLNFTQIADQLGFGSVHYFSRLFKEKTGLTPSQYARSQYENSHFPHEC